MDTDCWDVEQRSDGAVLVRVHSALREGRRLPDAVFAFRRGDPQYEYWERMLRERASCKPERASCKPSAPR